MSRRSFQQRTLWALVALIALVAPATAAAQTLQARVRILSHNVFGTSDASCGARAQTIGNNIATASPPYDLVGVQEYFNTPDFDAFSCDAEHLLNAIRSTGRYATDGHDYLHKPTGEAWELEADGGIGTFSIYPHSYLHEQEWSFNQTVIDGSVHGFTYTSVPFPNAPFGVNLVDVHLLSNSDGCDQACRREAMGELRSFLEFMTRRTDNPTFMVGDFNIGGPPSFNGNAGYTDIMDVLGNPRDLWFEAHPTENGYTYDSNDNSLAEADCGRPCRERIDYIFLLTDPSLTSNVYEVQVAPADVKLVKWTTAPPERLPVSDHWGLEATVAILGDPVVWVDLDYTGTESGIVFRPFNTLVEAIAAAPAGGRIMIRSGSTVESMTIDDAVVLEAFGGSVVIGE